MVAGEILALGYSAPPALSFARPEPQWEPQQEPPGVWPGSHEEQLNLCVRELLISDLLCFLRVGLGRGCSRALQGSALWLHCCTAWLLQSWAVPGHWHQPSVAHTAMATAHTGVTGLSSATWPRGFGLKSGTKLLRSKEVVSEQPQESKLNLFLSHLWVSVTK